MKGLIVRAPWVDRILDGHKVWEIRGSRTTMRGRIALIRSGSGWVVGTVDLVDCLALTPDTYYQAESQHGISGTSDRPLPYRRLYAWVLKNPERFAVPQPYSHPQGAVIWVNLPQIEPNSPSHEVKPCDQ